MPNVLFEVLRSALVRVTGNGYDRSTTINNLHHKLSYRLFKLLPRLGFGEYTVVSTPLGGTLKVRTDDGGVGHKLIFYREYEPYLTSVLLARIPTNAIVFNIGANIGYYAVVLGKHVSAGRVIAFEPEPRNFQLLQENLALNGLTSVTAVNAAVSDTSGVLDLYLSPSNFGDHRLHDTPGRMRTSVQVLDFASAVATYGTPAFVVMDTQGAEGAILRGMRHFLREHRTPVVMEYWPRGLQQGGSSSEEVLRIFRELSYSLFEISEPRRQMFDLSESALTGRDPDQETTILAVPTEAGQEPGVLKVRS